MVEIKEAVLLISLRPLTQLPLHFADIHQRFLRVDIRLPLLWKFRRTAALRHVADFLSLGLLWPLRRSQLVGIPKALEDCSP